MFNAAWNLLAARVSAVVALADSSRSATALLASASAFGLAAGPALGALVFRVSDAMVVYTSALVLLASAALVATTGHWRRFQKQKQAELNCGAGD